MSLTTYLDNNNVTIVDEIPSQNVQLVSYGQVSNSSSQKEKESRGLVFHNEQLILKSFPYPDEYVTSDGFEGFNTLLSTLGPDYTVRDAYEGTIIRVYNVNGVWHMSTHRKLDAFKSRWSSPTSFGESFMKGLANMSGSAGSHESASQSPLERFYSTLNPSHRYVFIVLNNEDNRLVCIPPNEDTVYHVGTFDEHFKLIPNTLGLPEPEAHPCSPREVFDFVNALDPRMQLGVICSSADGYKQIKLVNSEYKALAKFRGNTPSIRFRYLEVRNDTELTSGLIDLFPEHKHLFIDIEGEIVSCAERLHAIYRRRYVDKEIVHLPSNEHAVLKTCHERYIADRRAELPITLGRRPRVYSVTPLEVLSVLNKQTPESLYRMLKQSHSCPDTSHPVQGSSCHQGSQ
jgi:hypothetical protein